MAIRSHSRFATAAALLLVLGGGPLGAAPAPAEFGVYEYAVEASRLGVDAASAAVESAINAAGWRLLATIDAGVPEGCRYRARVFAVTDPAYASRLLAANPRTAPFGVVDRINVFEDEAGTHVAFVNAESVNRTILMDDAAHAELAREHVQALRAMLATAVAGKPSEREFGERRSKGHIGKTMGVMAGGPFLEKIKDEAVVPGSDWRAVAARLRAALQAPGARWGLRLAYELELTERETSVFGITGAPMESKSFSIVGAGCDDARQSFQCAGLAHAAAYPIEVVVARDGDSVRVRTVDAMYRMKLFFEDAGKWAFMKNMGMPGSIHDEIAAQIKAGLGQP